MATKIYDMPLPVVPGTEIVVADQVVPCGDNQLCFVVVLQDQNGIQRIAYL